MTFSPTLFEISSLRRTSTIPMVWNNYWLSRHCDRYSVFPRSLKNLCSQFEQKLNFDDRFTKSNLGGIGNGMTIAAFLTNKRLWNTFNIFIVNLSEYFNSEIPFQSNE